MNRHTNDYIDESKIKEKWNEVFKAIENSTPKKENNTDLPKQKITIGEYRLIPKGTKFWSIKNQTDILLDEDAIVEINNTCHDTDAVFVKQKQLIFNFNGYYPTIISKGYDEWSLSYSKTLPYIVPEYIPLEFMYNG
jgi:hypothetical protein